MEPNEEATGAGAEPDAIFVYEDGPLRIVLTVDGWHAHRNGKEVAHCSKGMQASPFATRDVVRRLLGLEEK
jgi:hypothetical protein